MNCGLAQLSSAHRHHSYPARLRRIAHESRCSCSCCCSARVAAAAAARCPINSRHRTRDKSLHYVTKQYVSILACLCQTLRAQHPCSHKPRPNNATSDIRRLQTSRYGRCRAPLYSKLRCSVLARSHYFEFGFNGRHSNRSAIYIELPKPTARAERACEYSMVDRPTGMTNQDLVVPRQSNIAFIFVVTNLVDELLKFSSFASISVSRYSNNS